jgi:hypothetical protein
MKTKLEAAQEYAEKTDRANAQWVREDFLAGVNFAQQWHRTIEVPLPKNGVFLAKIDNNDSYICLCAFNQSRKIFNVVANELHIPLEVKNITHWRPIEFVDICYKTNKPCKHNCQGLCKESY